MFARLPRKGLGSQYKVRYGSVAPFSLLSRGFNAQSCCYPDTPPCYPDRPPLTNREFLELHFTSHVENVENKSGNQVLLEWLHVFGGLDISGLKERQLKDKLKKMISEFERLYKNYNSRHYRTGAWSSWHKLQHFLDTRFEWKSQKLQKCKSTVSIQQPPGTNFAVKPTTVSNMACPNVMPPPSYEDAIKLPEIVWSDPACKPRSTVGNDENGNPRQALSVITNKTRSGKKMASPTKVVLRKKLQRSENAKRKVMEENSHLKALVGSRIRDVAKERDDAEMEAKRQCTEAKQRCAEIVEQCHVEHQREMQKLTEQLNNRTAQTDMWKKLAEEMMDDLNETTNEKAKKKVAEQTVHKLKMQRQDLERKVQRKDDKIKDLKTVHIQKKRLEKKIQKKDTELEELKCRIKVAEENLENEREAAEIFYQGIISELETRLEQAEDKEAQLKEQVEALTKLETKCGKSYTAEVRLVYYHLLTLGVSCNIIEEVVTTVLKNLTAINSDIQLPKRTAAQRMKVEAGYLATIKGFTAWARREDKAIAYQSDHTTRGQLHWLSHKIVLSATEEETNDRVFSLTIAPVHNETAEVTVSNLSETLHDLQEVGTLLGIDGSFAHVGQIKTHMKDRAAVETKVTRMLEDLKGDKLHETVPGWHLLSPEEQEKRKKIYGFTCAAHKIQNMAEAMSKAAQKNLKYDVETEGKTRRGMVGAKDHIYATAKLLCMETKKEYAEGKEFRGFALLHAELEDSGQKLFQPIVGNRFLVFFQNAVPCFVGKEMIQLYLTDKKLQKGNFNRLEEAVYNGYFNPKVMAEERAYSIMYYEVCLPLFSKCQEAGSPLDMNKYYQVVHDKLTEWANDATTLFEGSEPLWSQCRSAELQEYMLKVRQPHDTDNMTKETLSAMCKAGAEKLKQHAFEHLRGGEYHNPTTEHKEAAQLIGDATNLRIEQDFGILAQQQVVSPAANPLVHSAMVRAKQDKPAKWLASQPEEHRENLCSLARKGAKKLRKQWGTKEEQLKRLYEAEEPRRKEKKRKRDESLKRKQERKLAFVEALRESRLVVDPSKVNKMKGKDINYQLSLWVELEKLSKGQMKHSECLKNRSKLKLDAKKAAIRKLIRHNSHFVNELDDHLPLSVHRRRTAHQDSEWEEDDNLPLSAQVRRVAVPSGHDESDWEEEDDLPLTTVMDWYDSDMSDCADAD